MATTVRIPEITADAEDDHLVPEVTSTEQCRSGCRHLPHPIRWPSNPLFDTSIKSRNSWGNQKKETISDPFVISCTPHYCRSCRSGFISSAHTRAMSVSRNLSAER